MSLLRKLAGETAIYGFSYILSRVLHYILFTFYLTRVFNDAPEQYGIYRDLYFYIAILLVILTFRMETTYFRYAKDHKPEVTMMSMTFLVMISILSISLLLMFRSSVAGWLQYDGMETHLMLLGGVLVFDVMSAVPFAILRQQNRPWRFLALKLGSIVLNVLLVLFFLELLPILAGSGGIWETLHQSADRLYWIFFANLVASGLIFLLLFPLLLKQKFAFDFSFLRRMLAYSWPLVIVAIAGVINQSSAITFQKLVLPGDTTSNLADGGVYAAAASIAILLNLFTIAFNYAAEPFFFAHKDREDARSMYADVAFVFTLVGSVMMLTILAYMDVVQLLLGKSFRSGLVVVPILLLSYLLLGIYYNLSAWYKLADKTLSGAWIAVTGAVVTIAGNILLLPVYGVMGSAWTALACYIIMCVLCYVVGQRYYPIPYKTWRMIGWIGATLLFYALMQVVKSITGDIVWVNLALNTLILAAFLLLMMKVEKPVIQSLRKK